jgi:hypothetical protein
MPCHLPRHAPMNNHASTVLWLLTILAAMPGAAAEEPLVLRDSGGRFLRMDDRGRVLADRLFPTAKEAFTLAADQATPDGSLVLKDSGGRTLGVTGGAQRHVRPEPRTDAADRAVDMYCLDEVPPALRSALGLAIQTAVVMELSDEEYSKVRKRKREEYVDVPDPTLRKPLRTKRRRVLSMDEETHLRAKFDGTPTIDITDMPSLKDYDRPERGLLMFVVRARVPVRGEVRYKVPDVLSASTGYRAEVGLSLVGEIRAGRVDGEPTLAPPEVLDLEVTIRSLDLSNDVLSAARRPIEDAINRELREKKDRIRDRANKAIRKAVDDGKFRHPALRWLGVPEIRSAT